MRKRICCIGGLVAAAALALPTVASADVTLGLTTQPALSTAQDCSGAPFAFAQFTDAPTTPYMVPAGGGLITQWQTDTTGDTPGTAATFVVLRSSGGGNYTVVGTDPEVLPTPLPPSGVATFTLATPITVTGGETVGILPSGSGTFNCYWDGGSTPTGDSIDVFSGTFTPGSTVVAGGPSPTGFTMNLAYRLAPAAQDVGVTASAGPANATAGFPAYLSATVTNGGPGVGPINFTDTVPAGLRIDSVTTGSGSCTTAGQTVTCTITGLAAGQSTAVNIVVTPAAAGSYVNHVSVSPQSGVADNNATNNAASATLVVRAAGPPPRCVVLKLRGTPTAVAKHLLSLLKCKVGKVHRVHSSSVAKGEVIRTNPGAGTYAAGKVVGLTVSSGPAPRRRRHVTAPHFTG
jgi:hypothetical protein